jgi:alkylation response protein AidB-like acyl-CoA dehydrogenase
LLPGDSGAKAVADSLTITPEQRAVRDLAAEIARGEIAPYVARWDREHAFPRDLYSKFAQAGLMGMLVPERYGGSEAGYVAYSLAIQEIAREDAGSAVTLSVHSMICATIAKVGTEKQKEHWLPRLAAQDAIAGFALTESDAGSDAASIRATATRDGDGYLLNGRKQWCSTGRFAEVIMAMFRTGGTGAKGISAFLVDPRSAGVRVERVTEKLGIRSSDTCDLAFENVRVAGDALLGAEGEGLAKALASLSGGRIGVASQAAGILAACLDASVAFAKDRHAFGKPIGAFQGVSFKIARMATDLEAARALIWKAASLADAGEDFGLAASQAKLFASTAARKYAAEAVQVHGGYGYTTEFPVERYYRDAKITEIYEGTSEIQQLIIARSLLGRLD